MAKATTRGKSHASDRSDYVESTLRCSGDEALTLWSQCWLGLVSAAHRINVEALEINT